MSLARAEPPGLMRALGSVLRGPVPPSYRGRLAFAWIVLLLFAVQVGTGILLSIYYQASPVAASESIRFLVRDVQWGWLIRGLHHWAAQALIVMLLARLTVVLVTGGYRGARATGWFLTLSILWLAVLASFSGALLNWDDQAYWRLHSVLLRVEQLPWLGHGLASVLRGGPEISATTLSRTYTAHSMFLPWLIWLLLALNLWFLARRIHHDTSNPAARSQEAV